ncbi:diguanylate cyclase domain-containing protein [Clostridium sartagoforme]|jgi:diguanylate cyclase (GGDEF)-like protein
MNKLIKLQVNILSLFILSMLIFHCYVKLDRRKLSNKIFLDTSCVIFLIISIEIITVLINGSSHINIYINKLFSTLFFLISPIPLYMWDKYLYIQIEKIKKINILKVKYFKIPLFINTVLLIINLKFNIIFSIDKNNFFQNEKFSIIPFLIGTFYYISIYIFLVKHKHTIPNDIYIFISIMYIFPFTASVLELFIPELLLTWGSITTVLIFSYILLQQELFETDPLTGAFNRNFFNSFVSKTNKFTMNLSKLGAINIDLDEFKSINDTYGHKVGDDVLKNFVLLLNKAFKKKSKIIRMGGDEFIIIIENTSNEEIISHIRFLNIITEVYNSVNKYPIKFSYSYCIYSNDFNDIYDFFDHIDNKMYQNKYLKKTPKI